MTRCDGGCTGARDGGYVAVELTLGLGLLVLPMALLALSLPVWIQRHAVATAAAQEAARAVVVAGDARAGPDSARRIVTETATNNGLDPADLRVCFVAHPDDLPAPGTCGPVTLRRASAVTAHVRVRLPALALPGLDVALGSMTRTVSHTERVDRYRGLP